MGREDVIAALELSASEAAPRSAMTSASRARAERLGVDLPAIRAVVRRAWTAPGDVAATLKRSGLRVAAGDRVGVVVVKTAAGEIAGALDRLAGVPRAVMRQRLEADMARKKRGEQSNERSEQSRVRKERGGPDAGQARAGDSKGRRGDKGQHAGPSRPPVADRGVRSARLLGPDRSQAGSLDRTSAAAQGRRRRALITLRLADAAARKRAEGGRSIADDVRGVKAQLWRRMFGADLSKELVTALYFVDVRKRVVRLTSGGWLRDEGDRLLASGADPTVVAVMVAAAQAKGWKAARIWGSAEFLAEARRQFEAAGIPVTIVEPPAPNLVAPVETPQPASSSTSELVQAELQRRREAAEARLAELRRPSEPPAWLRASRDKHLAANQAWDVAEAWYDEAKKARDACKKELAAAGLFGRGAARRRLEAAQAKFEPAQEAFSDARARLKDAKEGLVESQREFDRAEQSRRAKKATEERRAQAEAYFAIECERVTA